MRLLVVVTMLGLAPAAEKPEPKWRAATVVYVKNRSEIAANIAGDRSSRPTQSVHQTLDLDAEEASYTVEYRAVSNRMLRLAEGAAVQFAIKGKDVLLRTPEGREHKLKLKATYEKPRPGALEAFNGRWDIAVADEPRNRCWWLEVEGAGSPIMRGKFVGAPGGQLDVIPEIGFERGELVFSFDRKVDGVERKLTWRARVEGEELKGVRTIDGVPGATLSFRGTRAPAIHESAGNWKRGQPVELFNGLNLEGWHSRLPNRPIGWRVTEGLLNNGDAGVPDLVTGASFWNFELHVEYRIGKGSNSGIGLRGRYEVQILDDFGRPPSLHGNGAIYSRISPSVNASRQPGDWQALDIRLTGRRVTVVLNDQKVIDEGEIEGLTAIAIDAREGLPGPIVLQGDHGPVEFRRITLTPLVE